MSIKRVLLIVLVISAAVLTMGGGSARARHPELAVAAATAGSRLSSEIVISDFDNQKHLPAAAYNWKHHEYLVVWHNTWSSGIVDIRAARVSDTGQVLSTFTVYEHPTKDHAQPTVAYDPVHDRYLVVWIRDEFGDGSDWDVWGRFIPWDGPIPGLSHFTICHWGTHQWNPKVAYGRAMEEFLVVWSNEYQCGMVPMYISGRRVKADGSGFPGSDSDLTISHATENRVNPDVTYNLHRNQYLVVYDNALDIFGTRFTGDLSHNFGGEFGIAGWPDAEIHPAVAACDEADQYLVAWQSLQPAGHYDVYARFIRGDGTPDSVHQIRGSAEAEVEPDVACNMSGRQYLVVWQQQYSGATGPYGIWGRQVSTDTTMSPEFEIIAGGWAGMPADRTDPVVAGGHTNHLVAWEHERYVGPHQDIHGRLVTPNSVFLPLVMRNF